MRQYLFYAFEEGDETAEEPRNQITKPRNVITASKKKKKKKQKSKTLNPTCRLDLKHY